MNSTLTINVDYITDVKMAEVHIKNSSFEIIISRVPYTDDEKTEDLVLRVMQSESVCKTIDEKVIKHTEQCCKKCALKKLISFADDGCKKAASVWADYCDLISYGKKAEIMGNLSKGEELVEFTNQIVLETMKEGDMNTYGSFVQISKYCELTRDYYKLEAMYINNYRILNYKMLKLIDLKLRTAMDNVLEAAEALSVSGLKFADKYKVFAECYNEQFYLGVCSDMKIDFECYRTLGSLIEKASANKLRGK